MRGSRKDWVFLRIDDAIEFGNEAPHGLEIRSGPAEDVADFWGGNAIGHNAFVDIMTHDVSDALGYFVVSDHVQLVNFWHGSPKFAVIVSDAFEHPVMVS